jgi:uncharacterized protein YfbU (UPF0304 family)
MEDIYSKFGTTKIDFEKKEKELLDWISNPIIELVQSIEDEIKAGKIISALLLLFVLIDILSSIEYKYNFIEKRNIFSKLLFWKKKFDISSKKRYLNWLQKFVYNDGNSFYREKSTLFPNKKHIWRIRCSFVHELKFPIDKTVLPIHSQLIPKYKELKKDGIFLPYDLLLKAVKEGYLLWINNLRQDIESSPEKYAKNILKMYPEFRRTALRVIKYN